VSITPVAVSGGTLTYAVSQYEARRNFSYYTSSESKGLLETEAAEKGAAILYTYNTNLLLQNRTEGYGTGQQQTTTYLHDELFGVKEINNPRGIITEFAYDNLGRLLTVKDLAGNIVKAYDYQYFSYPSTPINSVTEFTPRVAGGSLPSGIANLQTSIGYVDGLGRTLQNVGKEAGPNGSSDIVVNAQTYDATGRPKRTYVAFSNAGSGGLAALPATVHGDAAPYSLDSLFDNSPLKRVTKSYGPGQAWRTADKAVLMNYGTAGSEVPNITVTSTGTANNGNYNNYVLFKKTTTNERSLTSLEFSDKNGQVVERWTPDTTGGQYLKTSYIYDDLGRLRYVIQPQGRHTTTAFNETDAVFTHYVFAYQYDRRGRVIRKHTPGGGWTNIVYDALDRVVLQQDAQQATESTPKWTFIKYDAFNRPILRGETTNSNTAQSLQADFDNLSVAYELWQSGSYTTLSYPSSFTYNAADVREINYYDQYSWIPANTGFDGANAYHAQYSAATGLPTGSQSRNSENQNWLSTVPLL
jgi:YD repeat-containing protein